MVYHFKCNLCDAYYVGYTFRHLYQHVEEHKGSTIRNHVREQHGRDPSDIHLRFKILWMCQSKFDCLIYEMLFMKDLKANTEQTVRLYPRKAICIARNLLYPFFLSPLYIFYSIYHLYFVTLSAYMFYLV